MSPNVENSDQQKPRLQWLPEDPYLPCVDPRAYGGLAHRLAALFVTERRDQIPGRQHSTEAYMYSRISNLVSVRIDRVIDTLLYEKSRVIKSPSGAEASHARCLELSNEVFDATMELIALLMYRISSERREEAAMTIHLAIDNYMAAVGSKWPAHKLVYVIRSKLKDAWQPAPWANSHYGDDELAEHFAAVRVQMAADEKLPTEARINSARITLQRAKRVSDRLQSAMLSMAQADHADAVAVRYLEEYFPDVYDHQTTLVAQILAPHGDPNAVMHPRVSLMSSCRAAARHLSSKIHYMEKCLGYAVYGEASVPEVVGALPVSSIPHTRNVISLPNGSQLITVDTDNSLAGTLIYHYLRVENGPSVSFDEDATLRSARIGLIQITRSALYLAVCIDRAFKLGYLPYFDAMVSSTLPADKVADAAQNLIMASAKSFDEAYTRYASNKIHLTDPH